MKQNAVIATVQMLQENGFYFFTGRTLADLLGLSKVQTAQLLRRMQAARAGAGEAECARAGLQPA